MVGRDGSEGAETGSGVFSFYGIGFLPATIAAVTALAYRWQGIWYQSNNMQRADMGFCNYSPFLWLEKGRSKIYRQTGDVANVPIPGGRDNHNHKWNKRPELIARYLRTFSDDSFIVFDPFTGGGTVPAVCKMLGRRYLAFEIDPDTAEMARKRVRQTQPPLFVPMPEQLKLTLDTDAENSV